MSSYIRPPSLSTRAVINLIKDYFPFRHIVEDSIKELVSYDDRNYYFRGELSPSESTVIPVPSRQRVHIVSDNEYVLKILNRRDSSKTDTVKFLTEMKKYLYTKGLNVPFPILSLQGSEIVTMTEQTLSNYKETCSSSIVEQLEKGSIPSNLGQFCIRILTYIPGDMFRNVLQTPRLMFKLGEYIGWLHTDLKDFSHPGVKSRKLSEWDLKYLLTLRERVPKAIKDPAKLQIITRILNIFEEYVEPKIPALQYSVIHNDINDLNIVVAENKGDVEINGFIDFSDCVLTPVVFDLGIAMAYAMLEKSDPIEAIVPLLAGYQTIFKMSEIEVDLLYYIVLGRLAQSCINGESAYQLEPTNEYLLVSVQPAWITLQKILSKGKEECDRVWAQAKGKTLDYYQ